MDDQNNNNANGGTPSEPVAPASEPTMTPAEPAAPMAEPQASEAPAAPVESQPQQCATCGNTASGGSCVPCGQGEANCTCTPIASSGGAGGQSAPVV